MVEFEPSEQAHLRMLYVISSIAIFLVLLVILIIIYKNHMCDDTGLYAIIGATLLALASAILAVWSVSQRNYYQKLAMQCELTKKECELAKANYETAKREKQNV